GRAAAIPSAVRHLLFEQMIGDGVDTRIVVLEMAKDREHHAGDACLAPAGPFRPRAVVDAAVRLHAAIEQTHAGLSCLPARGGKAKVAEQQHRVGGRSPLGRVEAAMWRPAAGPRAGGVLQREQLSAPSLARDPLPFSLDAGGGGARAVAKRLPAN